MAAKRSRGAGTTKPDGAGGAGDDATTLAPKPDEKNRTPSLYVQIADRAYYIWLDKGMPNVGAMDFWFQAEAEVLRERREQPLPHQA